MATYNTGRSITISSYLNASTNATGTNLLFSTSNSPEQYVDITFQLVGSSPGSTTYVEVTDGTNTGKIFFNELPTGSQTVGIKIGPGVSVNYVNASSAFTLSFVGVIFVNYPT